MTLPREKDISPYHHTMLVNISHVTIESSHDIVDRQDMPSSARSSVSSSCTTLLSIQGHP